MSATNDRDPLRILLAGPGIDPVVLLRVSSSLKEVGAEVGYAKWVGDHAELEWNKRAFTAKGWKILVVVRGLRGRVRAGERSHLEVDAFRLFREPRTVRRFEIEAGRLRWVDEEADSVLIGTQAVNVADDSDEGLREFALNLKRWLADEELPSEVGAPLVRDITADIPGLIFTDLNLVSAHNLTAADEKVTVRLWAGQGLSVRELLLRIEELRLLVEQESHFLVLRGAAATALADPRKERVVASVFAPRLASAGDTVMVQVFAHLAGQEGRVASLAREYDDAAELRAAKGFGGDVPRGALLGFHLRVPGAKVDEPDQQVVWQREPDSVQFAVTFPRRSKLGTRVGTFTMTRDGLPVGHLKFKLELVTRKVRDGEAEENRRRRAGRWVAYEEAFISYAWKDRPRAMLLAQDFAAAGGRPFMDVLSLRPGERWEKGLYRHIDSCDVFFLCWSTAAKRSEWVRKETLYAHGRQGGDDEAPPAIVPLIIEGPPPVKPPPELSFLHFNDKFVYVQKGVEAEAQAAARKGK